MDGGNELEPNDSRKVTGTADTVEEGTDREPREGPGGEYEPRDSRNVTGVASTPDGRWTNQDGDDNGERRKHPRGAY